MNIRMNIYMNYYKILDDLLDWVLCEYLDEMWNKKEDKILHGGLDEP